MPQAYNITATLKKDEPNVFTFVYHRVAPGTVTITTDVDGGGGTGGEGGTGGGSQTIIQGEDQIVVVPAPGGADQATGGAVTVVPGGDGAVEDAGAADQPAELINLDDEETPLAGADGEKIGGGDSDVGADATPVIWAVAAGCVLLLVLILLLARKKRKAEEEKEDEDKKDKEKEEDKQQDDD